MDLNKNNKLVKISSNTNGIFRITLNNSSGHNVLSEEMMTQIELALLNVC